MKRRILSLLALIAALTAPVASYAQNRVSLFGAYNAFDFAFGVAPGVAPLLVTAGSPNSGTYTVTLAFGNTTSTSGLVFAPISVNSPVTIGGGTAVETVTPSAVSCSTPAVQYTCQFTATFANAHNNGDLVRSGDFGLEESAGYAAAHNGGLIVLSPLFLQAAGITTNAGVTTFLGGFKSLAANITVLNYSGIPTTAFSYAAAAGSNYASTTHILY
jgi:hypothetical protein